MENDKKKKISKFVNLVLDIILAVLLIALIVVLVTDCFADASLGLVNYGTTWLSFGASGDSSYNSTKGQWVFTNITDDLARVYFPNIGDISSKYQPSLVFNKPCSYTVSYSVGNPNTGEEEYVYYTGEGWSVRPIIDADSFISNRKYIYQLEVDVQNNQESDYTDIIGSWDLPQFINNTSAFHHDSLGYGYFDVNGEVFYPPSQSWLTFSRMRYYYDDSADFVNLYVMNTDIGEYQIVSQNECLVRYVNIDEAPNGTPNRLLAYFYDNGINLSAQGLTISIGGLIPNKINNGFSEFLSSVELKITDLQTLLDGFTESGSTLWAYIVTAVDSFFSLNIGGLTLGAVFGTLISVSILIAFLKLFLGG